MTRKMIPARTRDGRWLRKARTAAGLTQQQLADLLDEDHAWISRRETGARRLTRRDRLAIERVLGFPAPDP